MKRFLLSLLLAPAALGATYNVALPGGGVLTVNGAAHTNPAITNSASVVWGVDGAGFLYATATGTNSSIIYVEGSAVAGPNFGLSTEVDPVVTAATNITFSLVNSSITTNKIDATFYSLLTTTSGGGLGTNIFVNNVLLQPAKITNSATVTWATNSAGDILATSIAAGTGDVVGPASSTADTLAVFADATGKVIADGGVAIAELATEAEVAAGYQPLDDDLTDLADGSLTGSKVGSGIDAGNITTGTLSSNRLPAAVSFTTVDVGTINATAVVGDASGLTGINATNITAGELADARIPAAIARDSEVSATYAPLASPALTGDPTAPTAAANDNDTSIATTAYVQAEETALKALNLWQATNAALTALAGNPSLYQATNGNLTTLAGASITGAGNFMRTRTGVPREIWIPASAMNPGSDAPTPATNAWATTTDAQRWEGWDFSATTTNSVYFLLALPTAWDGGTVKAKLLWKQVVAAATATNSWQIGGGSLTDGETGGNTLGTLVEVLDVGANDTNVVSVSAASGAITIGGTPSAGHMTWFTVRRHPGDTDDNYAELSRLIGLHLQYTETATEPSAW